ncbi:MAG TPA: hypothetical protein VL119_10660 [Acidimicrobiia bacterium]|nr:hypothetical protein [Acidimicrobiia bacterium]
MAGRPGHDDQVVDAVLHASRALVAVSARGRSLVRSVTNLRRREITGIVGRVPRSQRDAMVAALHAFGEAAGERPDTSWAPEWAGE